MLAGQLEDAGSLMSGSSGPGDRRPGWGDSPPRRQGARRSGSCWCTRTRSLTTDRLIDAIWGERPPATATKSIHVYVSQLRQRLGAGVIETRPAGYELRVRRVSSTFIASSSYGRGSGRGCRDRPPRSCTRHSRLWRGQPLRTSSTRRSPRSTIARLEDLRIGTLEERIEADLGSAATRSWCPSLQRSRGSIRCASGSAARTCSRSTARGGRRRPSRPIRTRAARSSTSWASSPAVPCTNSSGASSCRIPRSSSCRRRAMRRPRGLLRRPNERRVRSAHVRRDRLLGREPELAELRANLVDAIAGGGRLVLVCGEPGIGKSRLLDEFATQAGAQGARVLWGRCWEAGGAPAYWPWCQSIRAYVRTCEPEELAAQLRRRRTRRRRARARDPGAAPGCSAPVALARSGYGALSPAGGDRGVPAPRSRASAACVDPRRPARGRHPVADPAAVPGPRARRDPHARRRRIP